MFRPGGVQAVVQALAEGLRDRGHEVKIVAPQPKEQTYEDKNLILIGQSAAFNTPLATKSDFALSIDNKTIDQMFEREQFDVVNFHEPWVPALSVQLLNHSKAVNVGTFHAKLPDTAISKSLELVGAPYAKRVVKKLAAITAVSDAAAEFVSTVSELPVNVVPNGISLEHYNPANYEPMKQFNGKHKNILYVGRLEKRKGVHHLLPAYRELSKDRDDLRLLIAGDGDKRATLELYVKKYALKNVEFLGFVSDEDKLRLLKTADLFVSPAIYGESFGIVLLEAMSMGVPTVAGNNPGYTSVMKERGAMSIVNPADTTAFAQRMRLFLDDNELRRLWKSWAKGYVQQFDYPSVVAQYEAVYKQAHKAASRAS